MDIYDFQSQEILERISRHCPESLSAYLQCFNRVDENGTFIFTKDFVEINLSENWRSFRNNIKKLARENLLQWHPIDEGIAITMADFHEEGLS